MSNITTTALQLTLAGCSVVPVTTDGTKRPACPWKTYTTQPADLAQIAAWFPEDTNLGVGVITGAVSGNLEMLEFEGRAMNLLPDLEQLITDNEMGDIWNKIRDGWSEQSPSGGLHLFYRLSDSPIPGNTKIAKGPDQLTLIETRGEGGFVVTSPSAGKVHPTGKPWKRLTGGPDTIATITRTQRDMLHLILGTADQTPQPVSQPVLDNKWSSTPTEQPGDVKPGDDYEAHTDWADILTGWTLIADHGRYKTWRRPGKNEGISATTGHAGDRDRLYVFSTSTEFEAGKPYTKFGAYAVLNHGGNHSEAARALHAAGYGKRAPQQLAPARTSTGTNATVETRNASPAAPNIQNATPVEGNETSRPNLSILQGGNTQPAPTTTTGTDEDLTDAGNARLAATEYHNTLKYVPDAGRWAKWEHTRWVFSPDPAPAIQAALDIADRLPDSDKPTHTHRLKSHSARALSNVVLILKTMPEMRLNADTFDQEPYQLNTPAGAVDLHTGQLTTPLPGLYHSKQTGATPNPDQPTPMWDTFLEETFEGDTTMTRYVQQLVGLSAIGEVLENILPFLHGAGGNGKSVFLDTIRNILGDYAQAAPSNFLMAGRDQHPTELAKLRGARFVIASEINEGTRFDEAKMKLLTGGDTISAHYMRQDFFEFTPSHTLWLMGNSQPKVETGGESFWRRLRLIPFTHTVTKKQRVENLAGILTKQEGPGILNWIIQGAVDYLNNGLQEPDGVRAATRQYKQEEDHLGRFITDCCHIGGGSPARIEMKELRFHYINWCREQDEQELNNTIFGRQLKQRFDIGIAKSNGRRYYTNIQLLDTNDTAINPMWKD